MTPECRGAAAGVVFSAPPIIENKLFSSPLIVCAGVGA